MKKNPHTICFACPFWASFLFGICLLLPSCCYKLLCPREIVAKASIKDIKERSNVFMFTRDAAISWEGAEKEGVLTPDWRRPSPDALRLASGTQVELLKFGIMTWTSYAPFIPVRHTLQHATAHFKVKGTDAKFRVAYNLPYNLNLAKDFGKAYALFLENLEREGHLQLVPSKQWGDNH